jgi:hypothetical protein
LVLRQTFSNKTGAASELALLLQSDAEPPPPTLREKQRPRHHTPSHVTLVTSPSTRSYVSLHVHYVEVKRSQLHGLVKRGKKVKVRTTFDGGHSHLVDLGFDPATQYFLIHTCDGRAKCWDGHGETLETVANCDHAPFNEKLRRYG